VLVLRATRKIKEEFEFIRTTTNTFDFLDLLVKIGE
jgi:hypothetical protein